MTEFDGDYVIYFRADVVKCGRNTQELLIHTRAYFDSLYNFVALTSQSPTTELFVSHKFSSVNARS